MKGLALNRRLMSAAIVASWLMVTP